MLNEIRGLEYTLDVLKVMHTNPGQMGSRRVHELVCNAQSAAGQTHASLSYIQKILQRMAKIGLLHSSDQGYTLSRPLNELTVDMVLNICDLPNKTSPTYALCVRLKQAVSHCSISEFYDFTSEISTPDVNPTAATTTTESGSP